MHRNASTLNRNNVNSVKYEIEAITSLGVKIWKILANNYKEPTSCQRLNPKLKIGKQMNALADYAKFMSSVLALFD